MRDRAVIAVDGPAGSGKSSVSKIVAGRLNLKYIDSGAIYRAITLFLLRKHGLIKSGSGYADDLKDIHIEQNFDSTGNSTTFVNGENVSGKIRDEIITKNIGLVSDDPRIRSHVNELLREWSRDHSIIMDGRDIGTVVFPDADVKIYLDASVEIRAERRFNEYKESGKTIDLNDIKNQIIRRDIEDKSRPVGTLRMADDSIYLDTSSMSIESVIDKIIEIINSRMPGV